MRDSTAGDAGVRGGRAAKHRLLPAGFPANGHAPPGYQPAIVYLPAMGGARVGQRLTGRGLVFSCSFCATSSLSAGRIPRSRR